MNWAGESCTELTVSSCCQIWVTLKRSVGTGSRNSNPAEHGAAEPQRKFNELNGPLDYGSAFKGCWQESSTAGHDEPAGTERIFTGGS